MTLFFKEKQKFFTLYYVDFLHFVIDKRLVAFFFSHHNCLAAIAAFSQ